MKIISETATDGVQERLFSLEVAGERVPGAIWYPARASGSRPLVLMGHGGSQHKKHPGILGRAHKYVSQSGFAVAAIDAPSHGDRVPTKRFVEFGTDLRKKMAEGKPVAEDLAREMAAQAVIAIPEWQATLDALQKLEFVGAAGPVGYLGLSMGAHIGVPFVAAEPRISAAVFGLVGLLPGHDTLAQAAARVTVPVEFVLQWGDELVTRESGLALFDAIGSRDKTMHANAGGHLGVPTFEHESWERFFTRHLVKIPGA